LNGLIELTCVRSLKNLFHGLLDSFTLKARLHRGRAMTPTTPRLAPIDPSEWTDEQRDALSGMGDRTEVLNIFKTLAHHPKLAKRWLVFANHILAKNSLSPRDREILILRAGWLAGSEYEWGQHKVIGRNSGLSDDEIEAIAEGTQAPSWSRHDRYLIQAADELDEHCCLSDETWDALSETYSTQQMMDVVFTCGQYRMLAGGLKSFGVQLDPGLTGF
jgi:alkylhydroperoxidase family enzyme